MRRRSLLLVPITLLLGCGKQEDVAPAPPTTETVQQQAPVPAPIAPVQPIQPQPLPAASSPTPDPRAAFAQAIVGRWREKALGKDTVEILADGTLKIRANSSQGGTWVTLVFTGILSNQGASATATIGLDKDSQAVLDQIAANTMPTNSAEVPDPMREAQAQQLLSLKRKTSQVTITVSPTADELTMTEGGTVTTRYARA